MLSEAILGDRYLVHRASYSRCRSFNGVLCHLVEVLDTPSNLAIQVAVQSNQVVEFSYRSRPAQPLPRSTRTTVANTLGNTGAWAVTLIAHALRSYVHLSTDSGKHHVHLSTGDALYMVHGADLVQQAIAFSFRRARTFLAIANVGRTSSPSPEDICSMNNIAYTDGQVQSLSRAAFAK